MLLAPYCNGVRTTTKCGVIVIYLRNGSQELDDYKIGNLGAYPKYPKEIKSFLFSDLRSGSGKNEQSSSVGYVNQSKKFSIE